MDCLKTLADNAPENKCRDLVFDFSFHFFTIISGDRVSIYSIF
jgi:hypothetical protein